MKAMKVRFFSVALVVLIVMGIGQTAFAAPTPLTLTLSAGDCSVLGNCATFTGTDSISVINATVGVFTVSAEAMALSNDPSLAWLSMLSFLADSSEDGTLTFSLTGEDFEATGPGSLYAFYGGTTDGNVSFETYKNSGTPSLAFTGSAPAFSGADSVSHGALGGPYSMTIEGSITHTGADVTSFAFDTTNPASVPEPTTILLLGAGLAALGIRLRKAGRSDF
jgi:hypothetical protein